MYEQQFVIYVSIVVMIFPAFYFTSGSDVVTYDKWKLLSIGGANAKKSRDEIASYLENKNNVKIINMLNDSFQVGIGPSGDIEDVMRPLKKYYLDMKLLHLDIGKLVKKSRIRTKRSLKKDVFERYMNLEQMENYFDWLEASYPSVIQRRIVGQSYEGRNISLFIISSKEVLRDSKTECQRNTHVETISSVDTKTGKGKPSTSAPSRNKNKQLLQYFQRQNENLSLERKQQQGSNQQKQKCVTAHSNATHECGGFSKGLLRNILKRRKNGDDGGKINSTGKPIVFIDAGTHSREWVSPAATLYFIKKLAETPSLTSKLDWYIIPMANPDGYEFSWKNDRFWRKTRSKSGSSGCYGADMNRNFDYRWGEVDTSKNPCSEHYGGERPSSEAETRIITDVLYRVKHRLKSYISVHNWGQDILYPYCHSAKKLSPHDATVLERVSSGMADAIRKTQNEVYSKGRGSIMLYPASGTSTDWAYDVLGVTHSYLIELRDKNGLLGFLLPDSFIKPTGEDIFAAMRYLALELEKGSISEYKRHQLKQC